MDPEEGDTVSDYERLVKCGFSARMARDILVIYATDPEGLAYYIRRMEALAGV